MVEGSTFYGNNSQHRKDLSPRIRPTSNCWNDFYTKATYAPRISTRPCFEVSYSTRRTTPLKWTPVNSSELSSTELAFDLWQHDSVVHEPVWWVIQHFLGLHIPIWWVTVATQLIGAYPGRMSYTTSLIGAHFVQVSYATWVSDTFSVRMNLQDNSAMHTMRQGAKIDSSSNILAATQGRYVWAIQYIRHPKRQYILLSWSFVRQDYNIVYVGRTIHEGIDCHNIMYW